LLLAILLAFGGIPARPATAVAVTLHPTTYRTEIRPRFEAWGYNGTMTLWSSNGYIHGTYRADSGDSTLVTCSGGRSGAKIWLDIPTLGDLHIEAHFDGRVITGLGTTRSGNKQYVFTATPESPSG